MSLIKPTITESLFYQFFQLQPDRPMYYMFVYQLGRNIFMNLEVHDKVEEMERRVKGLIEIPLKAKYVSLCHAYYSPRIYHSKSAYTKIGSGYNAVKITRYEMEQRFEDFKTWVYDEVIKLAGVVRFTRPAEIYG